MEETTDGGQRAAILHTIQRLPRELLTEENCRILRSFTQTIGILPELDLLAPSTRISTMSFLLRAHARGILDHHSPILPLLFDNDPLLKAASHAYLQSELSTNTDADFLHSLCEQIIHSHDELMLHEEHPVFLAAIDALTLSDPAGVSNPKNPYALYKKLKEQDAVPIELPPSFEETNGKIFSVSVQPLLDEAERIKRAMTFDQLPREVTANTVKDLFRSLDRRLDNLSPAAKERALNEIQNQCDDSSYESLKTGMLEDFYLQGLLHMIEPANSRVSLVVMQLFTILQFILSQPGGLEEGQILTKREETLLKIATSIRACSAGKKEGIFIAYNLIKGQSATALSSSEEQARGYLYPVIYRVLATLLSGDTPLMRALTETTQVLQLAHQAIYVKNLIGRKIGLV